jgi:hypothetical protein
MRTNPMVWIGLFVGSTVGSYIPTLWGAGLISFSGMFFSSAGAILGIWLGYRMSN